MKLIGIVISALLLAVAPLHAQQGAPSNCSGTVGTSSAAIAFPSSGNTGPNVPRVYLTIGNPASSGGANLFVNPFGATAVANGSGTFAVYPGGTLTWYAPAYPPPSNLQIIASSSSTAYTCAYQ